MKYYVRHDGTQTDKSNALIGGAAGLALSVAGFNAEAFAPGDEIIFENSGTYTAQILPPSSGKKGAPIIYRGPSATEKAIISIASATCLTATGERMRIKNFEGTNTGGDIFAVGNDSGKNGYTVKFVDCIARSNGGTGGDGFAINSTAGDRSEAEFIRCVADQISGAGDQGFTSHADQLMKLTDCSTTANCGIGVAPTGNYCEINGGSFDCGGTAADTLVVDGNCTLKVNNAHVTCSGSGSSSNLFSLSSGEVNNIEFNDCVLTQESSATGINFLGGAAGSHARIKRSTIIVNTNPSSFIEHTADCELLIEDCRFQINNYGTRLIRNVAGGGDIYFNRNKIDFGFLSIAADRALIVARNTSAANVVITGNEIKNLEAEDYNILQLDSGCVAAVDIAQNTFVNINGTYNSGEGLIDNNTGSATATIRHHNNVYHNCSTPYDGTDGLTSSHNCYSATPPAGDAVEFLNSADFFAIDDLRPNNDSILRESGTEWWGTAPSASAPLSLSGLRFADATPSIGAYQV